MTSFAERLPNETLEPIGQDAPQDHEGDHEENQREKRVPRPWTRKQTVEETENDIDDEQTHKHPNEELGNFPKNRDFRLGR